MHPPISTPGEPAAFQLAQAETQVFAQTSSPRDLRQGLAADQRRTQPRQGSFIRLAVRIVEQTGHTAIEHRIAQELQPLIMIGSGAAVSHCGVTQRRLREYIAERMFDPSLEFIRCAQRNHCTFTVLSKCTDSEMLAIYGTTSS